jgi:hypothetical protein
LYRARTDQPRGILRQTDRERRKRKHEKPEDEHAATAKEIAGASAEQEKSAERKRVGILYPGQSRIRKSQTLVDPRQACDHDRDIEDNHQVTDENDGEYNSTTC